MIPNLNMIGVLALAATEPDILLDVLARKERRQPPTPFHPGPIDSVFAAEAKAKAQAKRERKALKLGATTGGK